jgi:hypothetical protein
VSIALSASDFSSVRKWLSTVVSMFFRAANRSSFTPLGRFRSRTVNEPLAGSAPSENGPYADDR